MVISTTFLQLKLISCILKIMFLKQEGIQYKAKNRTLKPYCTTTDTFVSGCEMRCPLPLLSASGFPFCAWELLEDREDSSKLQICSCPLNKVSPHVVTK